MKFKTALRYRVIYQVRSLAIYFGFYALFGILFPLIGLLFSNDVNTVSSDAVIPCLVFMGILSFLGMNTDFKLFIQNGLSRWTIFLVNFVSNAILSLVGSLAVLVLIKVFSGNFISHFQLSMKLIDVYAQGDFFMSWLLFFILLMLSGSLGLLAGVFNDRIDGVKKLIVLLLLLMIPILLGTIAQLGGAPMRLRMLHVLQAMVGYQSTGFTVLPLLLTISCFVGINLGLAYLLNKHREIKRVNA
ncbi:MAG: hypothetical protein E7D10_00320 [Enterococcus faecalis]|nr:hypothetical protein [Enterococcus faecalis]